MIWKIFQRPSPNLGYFSVECANCPALNFVNKFPMFSGNAPLLEYFGGTIFRIDSQATWLSQIRALRFTSPFSAAELIDILSHMPLLEALGIYDNDQNDYADDNEDEEMTDDSYREEEEDDSDLDNSSKESKKYSGLYFIPASNLNVSTKAPHVFGATALPRVSLPRLSYISIDTRRHPGSCGKYLDILDNLTPSAKGCVLSFNSDDGIKPAIVGPAQRILRTYFEN
ncbi:hypothetical protein CPB84DRAFT_1527945 [Gymnopilus junonius]|uniref:Uncharacterized protein n=1 Tax=Gymnopilus junonius TaxID=109634 RepID=A0A9P5NJE7_GYMJU|nr:hypothetical protein CPB84DRAFT_1527945 [Gymnopilus junonius]